MTERWLGELPDELQEPDDDADFLVRAQSFLRSCAGEEALKVIAASDFRVRALHQRRERLFDQIANVLSNLEPEGDGVEAAVADGRERERRP